MILNRKLQRLSGFQTFFFIIDWLFYVSSVPILNQYALIPKMFTNIFSTLKTYYLSLINYQTHSLILNIGISNNIYDLYVKFFSLNVTFCNFRSAIFPGNEYIACVDRNGLLIAQTAAICVGSVTTT